MRVGIALLLLLTATAVAAAKPRWQELPLPPPMPEASAHGTVEVAGAQIYYARYGKADGDAVILLHGGLGNSDHWSRQVADLADTYAVYVIDSRGQGRSTRTRGALSYEQMSHDVLAVMDELKLERAAFVGWSDGGEIALKIAIEHPERMTKMFVLGVNFDASGSKPRNGPQSATFAAYMAKCRVDYQRMSATPKQWKKLVDWMIPLWHDPLGITKDQLRAIQVPTLISDGDHDEVILLSHVEELAKLIPNAQLKVFADTSHFALWQDPDDFDSTLMTFLAATPTPARAQPLTLTPTPSE